MRLLIINNLSAGNSGADIYTFCRALAQDGDEVVLRSTSGHTPIESLLDDATAFDAVVASGGDGTCATVAMHLADTGMPMLPFPSGTANLLAGNLDEPIEPHALAALVRKGYTIDVDLGEIEVGGCTHGFMLMAGTGYDAKLIDDAIDLKPTLGERAYFAAAVGNLRTPVADFDLVLDGEKVHTQGVCALLVNFGRIQFNLSVTPGNNPVDGMLELAIIKSATPASLVPSVITAILERDLGTLNDRGSGIELYRAHEIEIASSPSLPVQYDGEVFETEEPAALIHGRARKHAVRMIVDAASPRIIEWEQWQD